MRDLVQNSKENILYIHYHNCKNNYIIDEGAVYYWIFKDGETTGGITMWVDWADKNNKTEIRRLRPVNPKTSIESCTRIYGKPMVLK